MLTITIDEFGAEPRYADVELPDPASDEIEVELHASAVNPLDEAERSGFLAKMGRGSYKLPLVMGFDGAGIVKRVGDGASRFAVGDRVFGQFWGVQRRFGTYSEGAIVQERPMFGALERIPNGTDFVPAAASATAGMMALGALEASEAAAGSTILVLGAAGGVGTFVVQLAAANGVRVLASARSDTEPQLRSLGAAQVVPRGAEELQFALAQVEPVDAIIDLTGDRALVSAARAAVRDGGTILSIAFGISEDLATDSVVHAVNYSLDKKEERLSEIARLLSTGTLRPVIARQIPLADVLAEGARQSGPGKTIILPSSS